MLPMMPVRGCDSRGSSYPSIILVDLVWRTVDDRKIIPVDPTQPFDTTLFDEYDICVTGAALKQYESRTEHWHVLAQHTWVYARVSPAQKELILNTLRVLGYTTLMAGDGTNDVGALKQAHVGVALLDGSPEDLKKIAEHQRMERMKKVYESQLRLTQRFGQPPPPVPAALAQAFPELVQAQQQVAQNHQAARQRNPMERVSGCHVRRRRYGRADSRPV
jgi:manganese-transporting P-type ATPase